MTIYGTTLGGTDPTNGILQDVLPLVDTFNLIGGVIGGGGGLAMYPVGAIIPWLKTFTNTPALLAGWHECDGSVLSDASSVYNGVTLPALNTAVAATKKFLRGSTTSGTTGGATTHTHTLNTGVKLYRGYTSYTHTMSAENSIPPYYEVVFIIKVR